MLEFYLERTQVGNFTLCILSWAWARLQNKKYCALTHLNVPAHLLSTGSESPLAPPWWCGSAVADSEPEESLFGWPGPVDSSGVSAGTSAMSPDHRSPGRVRRRSQTDGCWYACDAWEVQKLAVPPSAFYISPTEGREGQVISINKATYFHAGQLSAMNTRADQGANIFTMVDSNIPTAHNLLAYILFHITCIVQMWITTHTIWWP